MTLRRSAPLVLSRFLGCDHRNEEETFGRAFRRGRETRAELAIAASAREPRRSKLLLRRGIELWIVDRGLNRSS